MEVASAPKKKVEKREQSEKVEPKTVFDLASEKLAEILASASLARTNSLKLAGIEYAGQLQQQLLDHATCLEDLYKALQAGVKSGSAEKVKDTLKKLKPKEEFGEKAKARP